jgi:dissimilatory sulfite reductase (desulfoviridin) alpha/beta subunit
MRRGNSSIFINAFLDLPQCVSENHCQHQVVVVYSVASQAVSIVDVYELRPVQSGQMSRDITKCVAWLHCSITDQSGRAVIRIHLQYRLLE